LQTCLHIHLNNHTIYFHIIELPEYKISLKIHNLSDSSIH